MSNYQVKNSSSKAVKFTVVKKVVNDKNVEQQQKEDVILLPGEQREMPRLAGALVEFHSPVNFTFRQKKAIHEKVGFLTKVIKESKQNVKSVELPNAFTILKIKEVHG